MVNSLMYCSEQIVVPETFPNILKDFAKAAIRTQPYDLLRWSSAYFRCLAQHEPPPAKCRLEEDVECGAITKGYLRVLLDQVGKGYFISREVLQNKWEGLCLPQEELMKYLSVCRMLNWSQVHWLKLFGVLVATLNESPRGTLTMLCELLTEDVEGGPARIPMWMFRTVYTFLAELDCSQEQVFVNGRKKLPNGELEPETVMDNVPKVFSTTSLKQQIMNECAQRYNEEYQNDEDPRNMNMKTGNECLSVRSNASNASQSSSVSSGFQVAGKLGDTKQIIQKCGDFDSLILLLRESQGAKLHEYDGPYHISQANIEHAKRREAAVQELREHQAIDQEENTKKYLRLESINMLREVGPPWSWIHQFVSNNCSNMSYNFIEEGSIVSDITPPESSDESFDFRRLKPISSKGTETDSHLFSTTTDNVDDLIQDEKANRQPADKKADKKPALQTAMNEIVKADSKAEVDLSDVSSIVSHINKDEMGVLLRGGERAAPNFSVEILDQTLRNAMNNGIVFENIDEVMDFVKQKYEDFIREPQTDYFVKSGYYQTSQNGEQLIPEEVCAKEISAEASVQTMGRIHSSKVTMEDREYEQRIEDTSKKPGGSAAEGRESKDQSSGDEETKTGHSIDLPDPGKMETVPTLENIARSSEPTDITGMSEMGNIFESCGIEVDPKLLTKKISDVMILGSVDKDGNDEYDEKEMGTSVFDTTDNKENQGGYLSDISRDDITTVDSFCAPSDGSDFICGVDADLKNASEKRPAFECYVVPYPGIGKSVSEKTIHDFLTYLKFRSRSQKGMLFPRNFREDKCPKMFD